MLYINGIAVGVIELKNSYVSIGDGIRQLLSNQQREFNEWFFTTVQLVFAGNDSEGLRYGTIGTPEKYFLKWKEDEADNTHFKLDKYLLKMCRKERLIEFLHDFVLFDGGVKKLPRVHQYFGVKAAEERVNAYQGGIIWHTQGSGKSIVMVLLAKWILENKPNARVLILTDRDELDKQIERVFTGAGEDIYRTSSGHDLMAQLGQAKPRLLCSLVHKFGKKGVDDFDAFIEELKKQPSRAVGELFIFVDKCHRTQSGKLHKTMKALLPGAVFIGFTGTPLLMQDKQTSLEVFGSYIHTYKFGEGVEDGVVLDLVYEARDIPQELGSPQKVDAWFEAKTKALNDWQKAALREQWGTMQKVLSSRSRMERVVEDIVFDFSVKPRLASERGKCDARRFEHLRGGEVFRAVPEDRVQGPVRACDFVQSAGAGRDARGNWREHGDRKAISLQHLHRATQGRGAARETRRLSREFRRRRTSSRKRCSHFWEMTGWRSSGFSLLSKRNQNTDEYAYSTRRHWRGRCPQGYQERPFERASADRTSTHCRPRPHEPRHRPRVRDCKVALDKAAAAKVAGTGTRELLANT